MAKGANDFGPFVSVGWIRPGCRWTVARRYLSENDARVNMMFREFYKTVVAESVSDVQESGKKSLLVPPWQIAAMHANQQKRTKGAEGEADTYEGSKRQKKTTV